MIVGRLFPIAMVFPPDPPDPPARPSPPPDPPNLSVVCSYGLA